jgi:hypothetical protein
MNMKLGDSDPIAKQLQDLNLPVYFIEDVPHHVYFKHPEELVELIEEEINQTREGTVCDHNRPI